MSTLVLVRHAQSEGNSKGVLTGTLDLSLTRKGESQARALGRALAGYSFKLVYTSDKIRAVRTADLLLEEIHATKEALLPLAEGALGAVPRLATPALGPRSYGDLEGRTRDELIREYGPDELLLFRRGWDTTPPNGDSFKAVVARAGHFWSQYLRFHLALGPDPIDPCKRSDVLVISHGNVISALMVVIEGLSPSAALKLEPGHLAPVIYHFETRFKPPGPSGYGQLLTLTSSEMLDVCLSEPNSMSFKPSFSALQPESIPG